MEFTIARKGDTKRNQRGVQSLVRKGNTQGGDDLLSNLVCVYGTLKRNHGNHRLLEDALYIGTGHTFRHYPLVIKNSGLPFLLERPGAGYKVSVEVYLVNNATLRMLDALEGHPNWYYRKKIDVVLGDDKEKAWVYFGPRDLNHDNIYHESY